MIRDPLVLDLAGCRWPGEARLIGAIVMPQPPDGLAINASFLMAGGRLVEAVAYISPYDDEATLRDGIIGDLSRGVRYAIDHPD